MTFLTKNKIISASGGAFASGAAYGWSSPVDYDLVYHDQDADCHVTICVTQKEFAWIIACLPLGAAIMSMFASILMQKIGRKSALIIFLFPICMGWIATIFARTSIMFYAGRLFNGFSCGAFSVIIPVYLAEISDKRIRGKIITLFQILLFDGILFSYILGYPLNLFWMNITSACLVAIYSIGLFFIPESPWYLVSQRNQFLFLDKNLFRSKIL